MTDMTPHAPLNRKLLWPESVLDFRDALIHDLNNTPLYIVGGAVRDAYWHLPVRDLDLATPTNAVALARKIANLLDGDIYVMDAERDVARVLVEIADSRLTIDVAHFRGSDLFADLEGRDFTINAMAVDLQGDLNLLIDPLDGERDINQKLLRRCGASSLADDPIRVLRAIRQSIQLGLRIDSETQDDIREQAENINTTSAERVRDELFNLLALKRVRMALRVADVLGVLNVVMPEIQVLHSITIGNSDGWQRTLAAVEKLAALLEIINYQRSDNSAASFAMGMLAIQFDRFRSSLNEHLSFVWPNDRPHEALLVLGALLHCVNYEPMNAVSHTDGDAIAGETAARLRLSNGEAKRLANMVTYYRDAQQIDYQSPLALHRYWYTLEASGIDVCLLGLANYLGTSGIYLDHADWLVQVERASVLLDAYFNQYDTIVSPPMVVNGNELMSDLNIQPGPIVGELLTLIREGQVLQEITSRDDALAAAQNYLSNMMR